MGATLAALVLGAAVAVAAVAPRSGGSLPAAVPSATFVDGDFTQSNSRDGMPVLEHPNLAPGHDAEGTVTIVNSGTLGGDFSLSVDGIADTAGPGGGSLSERLDLRVRDLQGQAAGYAGDLGALESLPLGYFSPGEAHTYAVALSFPDGAGDNAYAASSTSMRLVWDAVQSEPPDEGPGPDGGDTPSGTTPPAAPGSEPSRPRPPAAARPLRLLVRVPRVQPRGWLTLRTRCDRPCSTTVRARVRVGARQAALRGWHTRAPRAGAVRPRLRLPRALRRSARQALAQGRPVVYRVTLAARDRVGQRVVVKRRLIVRQLPNDRLALVVSRPVAGAR